MRAKDLNITVPVTVTTTFSVRPRSTDLSRIAWHVHGWRCRVSVALHGMAAALGRAADNVDPPRRHLP